MTAQPTPELYTLFLQNAQRYGVPLTLLEALAFEFSQLDASKVVGNKKGLFGFDDIQRTALAITDALDPAQNVDAAARVLAEMIEAFGKRVDVPWMLAGWHLGSVTAVVHLGGVTPDSWPADVRRFIEKIQRMRYWYQDRGMPRGADRVEHLQNAINALADANLGSAANSGALINQARDAMMQYKLSLIPDVGWIRLQEVWHLYVAAFDAAPVTNENTPVPERIDPDWWRAQAVQWTPTLANIGTAIEDAATKAGEKLNELAIAGLSIVAGLGVLWVMLNRRRNA
jgi:hypothetical protein